MSHLPPPLFEDDIISTNIYQSPHKHHQSSSNNDNNDSSKQQQQQQGGQTNNSNHNNQSSPRTLEQQETDITSATTGTTRAQRHFARLCSILADPAVDIDTIRLTLRRGVPDELRMDFWRLALGVVPLGDAARREDAQAQMVAQYLQLLDLMCRDVKDGGEAEAGVDPFPIDADIPRTMPTLHFFASPTHHTTTIAQQVANNSNNIGGGNNGESGSSSNNNNNTTTTTTTTTSAAVKFNKIAPSSNNPEGAFGDQEGNQNNNINNNGGEGHNSSNSAAESIDSAAASSAVNNSDLSSLSSPSSKSTGSSKKSPFSGMTFTPAQLALRRVLFLFSRVHRGRSYAQGMNEMVGLLLWAACNGDASRVHTVEADVFFCFQSLMQWCGDHFCSIPDHEGDSGLSQTLRSFSFLLEMCDPELHEHLEKKFMIVPEFYAFRWISILFVLEFPVADVLSLWDFILSFTDRSSVAAQFVAVAMLVNIREKLLEIDVSSCIELLQGYPPIDINDIIATAQALIDRHTVSSHLWAGNKNRELQQQQQQQGSSVFSNLLGGGGGGNNSNGDSSSNNGNNGNVTRRVDTDSDEEDVATKIVSGANAAMSWLSSKANSLFSNKDNK